MISSSTLGIIHSTSWLCCPWKTTICTPADSIWNNQVFSATAVGLIWHIFSIFLWSILTMYVYQYLIHTPPFGISRIQLLIISMKSIVNTSPYLPFSLATTNKLGANYISISDLIIDHNHPRVVTKTHILVKKVSTPFMLLIFMYYATGVLKF